MNAPNPIEVLKMTLDEASEQFSDWYNSCLENGIDPNDAVVRMGGMFLLTDEELIDKLQDEGVI